LTASARSPGPPEIMLYRIEPATQKIVLQTRPEALRRCRRIGSRADPHVDLEDRVVAVRLLANRRAIVDGQSRSSDDARASSPAGTKRLNPRSAGILVRAIGGKVTVLEAYRDGKIWPQFRPRRSEIERRFSTATTSATAA